MAAPILHGSVSAVSNRTERMMMRNYGITSVSRVGGLVFASYSFNFGSYDS